ncbi:MAG: mechanosensitive ion channel family protein [Sarcina sp.]
MKDIEIFFNHFFKLSFKQILIAGIILFAVIVFNKLIVDRVIKLIAKFVSKTTSRFDDIIVKAIGKPLKFFIVGMGIYFALKSINLDSMPSEMLSTAKYLKILIVITISMFLYNMTLDNGILHHESKQEDGEEKKVVFPFVAIVIRVIIIIVSIVTIANEFGLTGFLTGLGISGVVVAFAAQDTCSNLFGGMMIVLDKPFALGDWVKTQEVEGIVEEITFRSTRIRTFCKSLVTVPNSKLTNNNIINYTKRDCWQVNYRLYIDLDTTHDCMEKLIDAIKIIIASKDEVKKENILVKFNEISVSGYGIFVYFYIEMVSFVRYESLKEEVNIAILSVMEHYNIKFTTLAPEIKKE